MNFGRKLTMRWHLGLASESFIPCGLELSAMDPIGLATGLLMSSMILALTRAELMD